MKKFNHWLTELTKDERGSVSVKPVIAIVGALFLCVTMAINSFTHEQMQPSDNLVDAVVIITAIGMGADSLDKFSLKGKKKEEPTSGPAPTPNQDPEV